MGDFNWEIWGMKGLKKVVLGIAIGGLTELAAFLGTEPVPTQYVWYTVIGVELIEWALNAIKHSYN